MFRINAAFLRLFLFFEHFRGQDISRKQLRILSSVLTDNVSAPFCNVSSNLSSACICPNGFSPMVSNGSKTCLQVKCPANLCGVGSCFLMSNSSLGYYCTCPDGYFNSNVSGLTTCLSRRRFFHGYSDGLNPSNLPTPGAGYANAFFRHISVGYSSQPGAKPAWNFSQELDWTVAGVLPAVKDQQTCRACSTFATTSAIESLIAILSPSAQYVSLSEQQFIACGADSCSGGWVTNTLDYAAGTKIVPSSQYPYTPLISPWCRWHRIQQYGQYSISMYESVSLYGWFGLLLAVQQQPVIISIQGSSQVFLGYQSGVLSDPTCYSTGLDHSLLLIGYNLTAPVPYWLLQNSWGFSWGEQGLVRLAITDRDGTCGINVLPAFYPVIYNNSPPRPDPCNTGSFGAQRGTIQGLNNPCGGGQCVPNGPRYTCQCNSPFVTVTNVDGTQACAPASPCTFYQKNPCGVGACLDSVQTPGSYTCLCPLGYSLTTLAVTGSPACALGATVSGSQTYTVPSNFNVTCMVVESAFGVSSAQFSAQNPGLNCTSKGTIAEGTVLNVTNDLGSCSLPYAVNYGDSCGSIAALFSITLGAIAALNPALNCSDLQPGELVCVQRWAGVSGTQCTLTYSVASNDSCQSIIASRMNGDAYAFFKINPGLFCGKLSPLLRGVDLGTTQVCLNATPLGTILEGCSTGRTYTVQPGDSCARLYVYVYGSPSEFLHLNLFGCQNSYLYVGRVLCRP